MIPEKPVGKVVFSLAGVGFVEDERVSGGGIGPDYGYRRSVESAFSTGLRQQPVEVDPQANGVISQGFSRHSYTDIEPERPCTASSKIPSPTPIPKAGESSFTEAVEPTIPGSDAQTVAHQTGRG